MEITEQSIKRAFFDCCSIGDLEEMKKIVTKNAKLIPGIVTFRGNDGKTPLVRATSSSTSTDIISLLVEMGSDVHPVDNLS